MRVIGEPGVVPAAGAWVDGSTVIFRVSDPGHRLAGVRLSQDVRIPGDLLDFHRDGDGWKLAVGLPPVHRMEYLLELRYPDGRTATVTDPGNPGQAPGAFGPKSVLEFPWLPAARLADGPGRRRPPETFDVPAASLEDVVPVRAWAPADAPDDEPLPLLVVHDGPEYDALASLTRYLAAGVTGRWLPRLRAALLSPGPRDRWYSANARYARALAARCCPRWPAGWPSPRRIGMGTSLGGLAMLHAYCRYPDAFDALFLQSGSFFSPRFDAQERRFPYYRRVVRLRSRRATRGALPDRRVPVVLTCGVIEENAGEQPPDGAGPAGAGIPGGAA